MISTTLRAQNPWVAYTVPFLLFLACLFVFPHLPLSPAWGAALWFVPMGAVCLKCFPRDVPLCPRHWLSSTLIGIAVFGIWIAPDLLFPGYRQAILFSNGIVGHAHPSIQVDAFRSPTFLLLRTLRAVMIVPVVEELFWRGWLMRWLVNSEFWKVPLGTYRPSAFWITAVLFASEHGPYWDVGLLAGIVYNAWMIRSKSLADCIWMHAVTNAALCAYVITTKQWQYWQ
ncbi:MAG TPA: CAAX prenyl protease-related protein [Bryobacteraceae bacterium]|nr:CAAX prenyl protease-related protein [Bryobacteraceae bacterium]